MAFNGAGVLAVENGLQSAAARLGVFDRIIMHEPKSAPGSGTSLAIWWDSLDPVPALSGLNAVTTRIPFRGRIYRSYLAKGGDADTGIETSLLAATCALLAAWTGDFTLGGVSLAVDILGMSGGALSATSAYMNMDGHEFRIADLTIPVLIDNAWLEVA